MVIPNWNPREALVTGKQVKIGSVGGMTLAVIIESEDITIR